MNLPTAQSCGHAPRSHYQRPTPDLTWLCLNVFLTLTLIYSPFSFTIKEYLRREVPATRGPEPWLGENNVKDEIDPSL